MITGRTSHLQRALKEVSTELARLSKVVDELSGHHENVEVVVPVTQVLATSPHSPGTPTVSPCGSALTPDRAAAFEPATPKSPESIQCKSGLTRPSFLGKSQQPMPPMLQHPCEDEDLENSPELPTGHDAPFAKKAQEDTRHASFDLSVDESSVGLRGPALAVSRSGLSQHRSQSDVGTDASPTSLIPMDYHFFSESGAMWPLWERSVEMFFEARPRTSQRLNTVDLHVREVRSANFRHRDSDTKDVVVMINAIIINPRTKSYFLWQILGGALILIDVIVVPMAVFDLPEFAFFEIMAISIVTYWIIDCGLQFCTGYELRGSSLEMRPSRIVRHYIRTWFFVDVIVIMIDLVCIILGLGKAASHSWHLSKSRRALRILRLFKILRLLKMFDSSKRLYDKFTSEHLLFVVSMFYATSAIFLMCHYAGCYWFGVGNLDVVRSRFQRNWLDTAGLSNAGLGEQYVVSLHWALAQSGLVPISVTPTNTAEHLYTIVVCIFWLCGLSGIISIFVLSLIRIRDANRHYVTQEALMRRYLWQNDVSSEHTSRTLRFFRLNFGACLRRTHQSDLEFFKELPVTLQVALHQDIYGPILKTHPLFTRLYNVHPLVCHLAMEEVHCNAEYRIFQEGEPLEHMFWVRDGRLEYYIQTEGAARPKCDEMVFGDWVGEPTVWVKNWHCRGRLVSASSSELVTLSAPNFRDVITNSSKSELEGLLIPILSYASSIKELLMDGDLVTDYIADFLANRMVDKAFRANGSDPGAASVVARTVFGVSTVGNLMAMMAKPRRTSSLKLYRA